MTAATESMTRPMQAVSVPIFLSSAEAEVIRILWRQASISRPDIADITGWSKAKTSQLIQTLLSKGYLVEAGEEASQGGRKAQLLRLNDQLGYLVGLDIGATSIDVVLADVSGHVLQRRSEAADVRQAPDAFLSRCSELILNMVTTQPCRPEQILGIGVGVPGPVDFARGVLVAPPLMPLWENFPIRSFFQKTFTNAYVVIDNDVNIMALGEQRAGEGVGVDDFLFVKIGTGIGCGIVSNGKMHRGSKGCAGDIGHICVDKQGPICRCGNTGCLEAMAAGPAIVEKAMKAAKNGASPFLQTGDGSQWWLSATGGCERCLQGRRPGCAGNRAGKWADDRGCIGEPGEFFQPEPYLHRRGDHEHRKSPVGCNPAGSATALTTAGNDPFIDPFRAHGRGGWRNRRAGAGARVPVRRGRIPLLNQCTQLIPVQ